MLLDKSITELAEGLQKKEFSCVELVKICYAAVERLNPRINAFISTAEMEKALFEAKQRDKEKAYHLSKLYGIPFVLKDSYVTKGIRTTAASAVLGDYIGQYDATVYRKLKEVGAILIGKMNMDAWGHGGSTENTDFAPTRNPWDLERVAGGSGGGPAAAIAARMVPFAIGEDTGGSIRNPAAWCNITGLKVTYGRVSRYGCIAYASSFDTVGPTAKSVQDCAVVLEAIAGKDPYDATSSPQPVLPYSKLLDKATIENTVIGIPKEYYGKGLNREILEAIMTAAKEFEKLGAKLREISLPLFAYGIPVYYLVGLAETSSNLSRYDGLRYGNGRDRFTSETMRRIMIGTYALSAGYYEAYYHKAQQARTLFIREYARALDQCNLLLAPVNPISPPCLGELIAEPLANFLADIYTTSQNPVGVPSLALPCGFTQSRLPIGMQLVGKMFTEDLLLRVGHAYQQITDWHKRKPKIA